MYTTILLNTNNFRIKLTYTNTIYRGHKGVRVINDLQIQRQRPYFLK